MVCTLSIGDFLLKLKKYMFYQSLNVLASALKDVCGCVFTLLYKLHAFLLQHAELVTLSHAPQSRTTIYPHSMCTPFLFVEQIAYNLHRQTVVYKSVYI